MKKLALIIVILVLPFLAFADDITLDSTQQLSVPTAAKISDWEITKISASQQTMKVRYRWQDSGGTVINMGTRQGWQTWTCRNTYEGNNESCTDVETPWLCCTGPETGTCPQAVDTCFSDVFSFSIREQDVGTSIGAGLRTLIWNKMKADILTGGNDGDFD